MLVFRPQVSGWRVPLSWLEEGVSPILSVEVTLGAVSGVPPSHLGRDPWDPEAGGNLAPTPRVEKTPQTDTCEKITFLHSFRNASGYGRNYGHTLCSTYLFAGSKYFVYLQVLIQTEGTTDGVCVRRSGPGSRGDTGVPRPSPSTSTVRSTSSRKPSF